MTTRKRCVLIGIGSVFGIAVIALATFIAALNQDKVKNYTSKAVTKVTRLRINGDLRLSVGWISRVSANQIQFENAGWSRHPQIHRWPKSEISSFR